MKVSILALLAQLRTALIIGILGVAALVGVSFLTANPLETFLRLISFAGIGLLLVSVAVMMLTFKTAREIIPAALLISLAVTIISTLACLAISSAAPSGLATIVAVLGGGLMGAAWSLTSSLFVVGSRVRMRGTIWYLAVWALTLAFSQSVAILIGRTPIVLSVLTLIGVGLAAGNTLGLIWRTRRLEASAGSLGNDANA